MRFSLIHTFATFILLSYVKILNVSYELLAPSYRMYNINGTRVEHLYLKYDGTVKYLSNEHKPFAALAIIMTLLFNIAPLCLLLVYPCRCFQKMLSCVKLCPAFQTLHTFMDVFYGCFHHRPRDYRYFAALYVLLRIVNLITLSMNPNFSFYYNASTFLIVSGLGVAVFRPHKDPRHSIVDVIIILINAGCYQIFAAGLFTTVVDPKEVFFYNHKIAKDILFNVYVLSLPLYGVVVLVVNRVLPLTVVRSFINYVRLKCFSRYQDTTSTFTESESLPDRLVHSQCS